jgi:uncharacterized membrane protein YgcG
MSKKKASQPSVTPTPAPVVSQPPASTYVAPPTPPAPAAPVARPAEAPATTLEGISGKSGIKKRYTSKGSMGGGGSSGGMALQASVARKSLLGQ